jgi:hypothetical protein
MSSGSLRKGYTDGKGQKEKTGQYLLAHDSSIQQIDRRRCWQIVTVLSIYFARPWSISLTEKRVKFDIMETICKDDNLVSHGESS